MKTTLRLYLYIFLLAPMIGKAQVTENFSDGNISSNPLWVGNTGNWLVNTALQLQSNDTIANSTYYLSTASTLATNAQWEFYVNLSFNTSSSNYADIFLTASAVDLTTSTTVGYFVRIGNTADEISLYRKDGATSIKIIDGVDGTTNNSNNVIKIRVTRDASGSWELFRDITGAGTNFFKEGNSTDATYSTSSFFGILVKQSTVAGFAQKHFFDDIEVKAFVTDVTPPEIISATAISVNAVDVIFNEPLDDGTSKTAINYVADNLLGTAATAALDAFNAALVHVTFAGSFTSGTNYRLTVNGVKDLTGNGIVNSTTGFIYFAPYTARQYDVVMDEIMADPSPQVSLPNNEWIELKNTSTDAINLEGWRIADATGQSGPMPNFILLPDSFVILCASSATAAMAVFGTTISVTNFPSLDNIADQLILKSAQNKIIHSVNYTDSWYQNELKKNGGWTLEMIDTKNPCAGFSNWKASTDLKGGSPGKKNAVDGINPDTKAPRLLRAYAKDSVTVILIFDEVLDSLKATATNNFTISDGIGIPVVAVAVSPLFDRVSLKLNNALSHNKLYTVIVAGLADCVGNVVSNRNTARAGISEVSAVSDMVINEILFNPPTNGNDYVEIYNGSKKIIDLKQTYIANRNSSGAINNITQLSAENYLLFPQDFMVVTENIAKVKATYIMQNPDAFIEVSSMPSFNNDKGTVVLLNAQGEVVDELRYDEKWHFKLIDNREGVALERIDYSAPTQLQDNWHSAATSSGYGTPGYKNSQYRINDGVQGDVKLSPEIVSPDNDGQDDFATMEYNFPQPGYVANITIFDASGRPVRYLQRNALCGTKGSFRWDGLGENSQQLATGVYIILTELFNLKGNKREFKNTIVVAIRN